VWLSTRQTFREEDEGWASYQDFIGLSQLREVRTIDSSLNRYVEAKARFERETFAEFVEVARLPVVAGSVASRPTPEPDILCELVGGEMVAFELVRLVDPDLASSLARDIATGGCTAVPFADPTLDRVREKCVEKTYVTPYPMELLVYGDDLMLPYDVWLPKFERDLKDLLNGSAFRRLWVVNLTPRGASRRVWLVHTPFPPTGR
jgi:hypothetical protein